MKKKKKQSTKLQDNYFRKQYNSKIRQEYTDLDYVHKLDNTIKNRRLPNGEMVTEFEWMKRFMKEWNNADVGKQSEARKNSFHRTAKAVKECTDRNNHRNQDQYGRAKAQGMMYNYHNEHLQEMMEKATEVSANNVEDALIEYLDQTKKLGNSTSDTNDSGEES